jgi:hypothetical protein
MFAELLEKIDHTTAGNMRRTVVSLAQQYDDFILLHESVPDEAVDFLLKLFSDPRVLGASGIEHFLMELNVDQCKYTQKQLRSILGVLVHNVDAVTDELGRHSIGDFIARAYPNDIAFTTLVALALQSPAGRHVAFVGFDVLRKNVPEESSLHASVELQWNDLLRS